MGTRAILIALSAAAVLAVLAYLDARLERADEADALEAQVYELRAAAAEKEQKAVALETELQASRLKATEINKKWSRVRAQQNRNPCQLDADTIGLLRAAGDPR